MSRRSSEVTITDIAKVAGVSTATVSRVLNNSNYPVRQEVRDKVLKLAKEMNYVPNLFGKMLKGSASKDIGVILPSLVNPFYTSLVTSIENTCREYGMTPIFCVSNNDSKMEKVYIRRLLESRVAGMLISTISNTPRIIQDVINKNTQVVLFDQHIDCMDCDSVGYDFFDAGRMAVRYLVENGHRNIAFLTLPLIRDSRVSLWKGIRKQFEEFNMPINENCLMELKVSTLENGKRESFEDQKAQFEELLKINKDCTAIIVVNDMLAIEFMRFSQETGRKIPEDISIIGFDDIDMCDYVTPKLTSISQSTYEMGALAVKAIMARIDREKNIKADISTNIMLKPSLVERESVKKIGDK